MMGERFLPLNSGGFDSVVMAHRVRQLYPNAHLTVLCFNYGQRNIVHEVNKSSACAEEIGAWYRFVVLPQFDWTNGDFYKGTADTAKQYLEYRNLIFLSYAASIAESLDCTKIYMATHCFPNGGYKDGNNEFIDGFNKTIAQSGIQVVTPFAYVYKEDLMYIAKELGITRDKFFSCNNPKPNGEPCGECGDCKVIEEMYSS